MPRRCDVCGGKLRIDNTTGLCRRTSECIRERARRSRAADGPGRRQRQKCSRPGCENLRSSKGVCAMHYERFKRSGEYGPAESLVQRIVINPGDRFGRWTVLEGYVRPQRHVLCRCVCGTQKTVDVYTLMANDSRSCGWCGHGGMPRRAGEPYMRAGEVCGLLTALEDAIRGSDLIRFRCECGGEPVVKNAGHVRRGQTRSCGHLRSEKFYRHGLSKHPLYNIWKGILRRCENPKDPAYEDYREHGITVCEGWHGLPDGLLSFAAHMGERPAGHTVDRPDNNGGYWCGRCAECTANGWPPNAAWKTPKEQNANRRSVHTLAPRLNAALAEIERLTQLLASRDA
jgi:hypothetical protein